MYNDFDGGCIVLLNHIIAPSRKMVYMEISNSS